MYFIQTLVRNSEFMYKPIIRCMNKTVVYLVLSQSLLPGKSVCQFSVLAHHIQFNHYCTKHTA
jgi:hypothetical protein